MPKTSSMVTMAVFAAGMLSLPSAMAAAMDGSVTVRSVSAPPATRAELAPSAAYLGNASWASACEMTLPAATVTLYQQRFIQSGSPLGPLRIESVGGSRNESWRVEGATLRVLGEGGGGAQPRYLGVYPGPDASLDIVAGTEMTVTPAAGSSMGSARSSSGRDPSSIDYFVTEHRPHLRLDATGQVRYEGLGAVKLSGLRVAVETPEGTSVYETGSTVVSPAEVVVTTLFVVFDEPATLTFDTGPATLQIAAARADLAGSGGFTLDATGGEVRSSDGDVLPMKGIRRLEGAFALSLRPVLSGKAASMTLQGEAEGLVTASSLTLAPALRPLGATGVILLGGAFLAVTLAGAAGGVGASWTLGRRVRGMPAAQTPPFRAEDCMEVARAALEQEDYPEALEWLRRAHALAPASARIAADIAFCMEHVGGADEAIEWYAKAHALSTDGEAAFNAARAARDRNLPASLVLHWLGEAMARTPAFVDEVSGEFPEATALPGWPAIEAYARKRTRPQRDGVDAAGGSAARG